MHTNKTKESLFKRKFSDWKSYTLITVGLWLLVLLMAGSVVADVIMAVSVIPAILAIVFNFAGIFQKGEKTILIKKGKESLTLGFAIVILFLVIQNVGGIEVRKALYSISALEGLLIFSLILLGILCLIRGTLMKEV